MRDAGVLDQAAGPLPAKAFEEHHVAGLDERLHLPPAALSGRGDRVPHQRRAETQMPVAGQHREPVALPPARAWHRVEPDRSADVFTGQADDEDRRRVAVVGITVAAAAEVGTLDATGQVRVRQDGQTAVAFDLTRESVTNLAALR